MIRPNSVPYCCYSCLYMPTYRPTACAYNNVLLYQMNQFTSDHNEQINKTLNFIVGDILRIEKNN